MLPKGYRLAALEETASTNAYALTMAAEGAADRTIVWAARQTSGRGRMGRPWVSAPGNLFCSFILHPRRPLCDWGQLTFVAALAVAETIGALLPEGAVVGCKWPNDVLLDGQAKISGILLETGKGGAGTALIMGIGINLASHPDELDRRVTSVLAAGGAAVPPRTALDQLAGALEYWRLVWENEGFEEIRLAWLERAVGLGKGIEARISDRVLRGKFLDLAPDGALVLENETGHHQIHGGEVFFLQEADLCC